MLKKSREYIVILLLAFLGIFWWLQFAYPRYQYIDSSVNASQAITIAKDFLLGQGYDLNGYSKSCIFEADETTDRYLQKTIGIQKSQDLIKSLNYDLFGWYIRFFKEKQKEEYGVFVSSKNASVIGFRHIIEETANRNDSDKGSAKQKAIAFLQKRFSFNHNLYRLQTEQTKKQPNRIDYKFVWESTRIEIPWDRQHKGGSAKLLTTVMVSGDEVLSFTKAQFDIPDAFNRYVENLKQTGENLTLLFRLIYLGLLTIAIMFVVRQSNHFVVRTVKSVYVKIGILLYLLLFLEVFNSYQYVLNEYPTTQVFNDYVIRKIIESVVMPVFVVMAFILPALAGESLRFEVDKGKKEGGFFSGVLSSFSTRPIAKSIIFGYAFAAFLLGVQAFIYDFGFHHCGVWEELSSITRSSSSVLPALTALLIAVQASFGEETMFRMFVINLLRKYKLGLVAVFLSAIMWGVGHTAYQIYPMWFRGLEVSCLGVILGFAYLRYGLITVITAHYLMDAFLGTLPFVLFAKFNIDFISSILILSLPLIVAIVAFVLNRSSQEKEFLIRFNASQQFNHDLLCEYIQNKSIAEKDSLRVALLKHGWDQAVVQSAFEAKE